MELQGFFYNKCMDIKSLTCSASTAGKETSENTHKRANREE